MLQLRIRGCTILLEVLHNLHCLYPAVRAPHAAADDVSRDGHHRGRPYHCCSHRNFSHDLKSTKDVQREKEKTEKTKTRNPSLGKNSWDEKITSDDKKEKSEPNTRRKDVPWREIFSATVSLGTRYMRMPRVFSLIYNSDLIFLVLIMKGQICDE